VKPLHLFLLAALPLAAHASPWQFSDPVDLTETELPPHFHHLDGAGRSQLAVAGSFLALTWEDDRDGDPQVYVAIKAIEAAEFHRQERLSTGAEAYEPTIVSLGENHWFAAWEQDGAIVGREIKDALGPLIPISGENGIQGGQVTLAANGSDELVALWIRLEQGSRTLTATRLDLGATPGSVDTQIVAPVPGKAFQGYPAATFAGDGNLVVGFEDRRKGHTRLYVTWRAPDGGFSEALQINEHREPDPALGLSGGKGTGVMRITLSAGEGRLIRAAWLDKRSPGSGYAVWGSLSEDGGRSFMANEIVQDEFGASTAQWHASVLHGADGFVCIWDDAREAWDEDDEEAGDVFVSWRRENGWSEDFAIPGASGEGYQGSPVGDIDNMGNLHVAWIERENLQSPSRLRYILGRRQ